MANHVHIDDDLLAMEITCWDAFIGPEQESHLLMALYLRERPDNLSFQDEYEPSQEAECSDA